MEDIPVPETLETIAEKITALGNSVDQQFAKVDQQFAKVDQQFAKVDQQFAKVDERFAKVDERFATVDKKLDETKAQLGVKIEAVDRKVMLVFDAVISLRELADTNTKDHQRFTERLDKHDVRILALEPSKSAKG
jgi:septal ring factor EnvC (AmiA/AmiB activator)